MANTIQLKRGNAADWTAADPTLAAGEFGFETDTAKFKVGDGSTAWSALGYFEAAAAAVAWTFQGSSTGYSSKWNRESFSLVSDGNAVQIADYGTSSTAAGATYGGGVMSSEYAFITGLSPTSQFIEKFPFAADSETATSVGTLSQAYGYMANNNTATHGYTAGHNPVTTNIDKFSTVSDGDGAVAAYLTVARYALSSQNSDSHGYHAGGYGPAYSNVIDKFPFAADGNSVDVGDISAARYQSHGMSSTENGYVAGGQIYPRYVAYPGRIDKFSFASDGNATYIGNLTTYKEYDGSSVSSTTHGYSAGGFYTQPSNAASNVIEKFSFTSDGNSVDVGDMVNDGYNTAGFQI